MDKEIRKKIKEVQKQVIAEEKAKKRFLDTKLDYNYLQYMINQVDADDNLVVEVILNDGTQIKISKKKVKDNSISVFNDVIAPEDVR